MRRLSRMGVMAALAMILAAPVARAAEPDKLLPPDADTVMVFNVKQILESDIIKKYALDQLKQSLQGNDAQKFLQELGLDPLKDIEKLVIGGSGKDQTDMKYLMIIRGKFDPAKLYKAAEVQSKKEPDKFSLVKDGKDVMFKFQPDNGNPMYATVVDEGAVIVASDKKGVTTALAQASAGGKPAISKDLSTLITRMDDKSSMWIAAVVKGKLDNVKLPKGGPGAGIQDQLVNLDNVTVVLRVNEDISLDITLGMKDVAAADEMGKTVDELIQTVRGALPFLAANDERMKPLVDVAKTLKSTVKDKSVSVTAKLPGAAIGKMLNPGGE